MSTLERLEDLLRKHGVSHLSTIGGEYLMWEGAGGNWYLARDSYTGDDLFVMGLTPEQVVMATLGTEGCPVAMSGLARCERTCGEVLA